MENGNRYIPSQEKEKFSDFKVTEESIENLKPKDQESKDKLKELFAILEEMVNCDYKVQENLEVPSDNIHKIDHELLDHNNPIWAADKNAEKVFYLISVLNKLNNDLKNNEEYKKIIDEAVALCLKKDESEDRANSIKIDFLA